jgi:hypothetical protein
LSSSFLLFFSTKWQRAVEVIGNKCEAKVPDLIEGMKYEFRVKAINKAGTGPASDPSDSMVAKNRYGQFPIDNMLSAMHSTIQRQSRRSLNQPSFRKTEASSIQD